MNTLLVEIRNARAIDITVSDDTLTVDLEDDRTVSVPIGWYPRLQYGTSDERSNWRLIGKGEGIHWPDLDEDINVEDLIAGIPSGESQRSLQKYLDGRAKQ